MNSRWSSLALVLTVLASACALVLDLPNPKLDAQVGTADASGSEGGGATDATATGEAAPTTDGGVTCDLSLPANCGACGVDCSKGACNAGKCTLAVSIAGAGALFDVGAMALHQDDVFVTVGNEPAVVRCPRNGCTATGATDISGLDGGDYYPTALAVEPSGTVVWSSAGNGKPTGGVYRQAPSAAAVFVNQGNPTDSAYALALVGDVVLWVDGSSTGGGFACPLAGCGGPPTKVTPIGPYASSVLATPSGGSAWLHNGSITACETPQCNPGKVTAIAETQGAGARALAISGDTLYWVASYPTRAIMRAPLAQDGGSFEVVYPPIGSTETLRELPDFLLIEGTTLYWAEASIAPPDGGTVTDGRIQKCTLPACTTATTFADGLAAPIYLASDGVALYWINNGRPGFVNGRGSIMKAPL